MPDASPSRPWWRHPAVAWAAALIALRITGIVLFRRRQPAFLDAVRRANKRVLNPVMLHRAGHRHWYAARLEHVGRRSGRRYATPVVAQPVHGGFAIPLPYGPDVDWRRNLQAAGSGVLQVDGVRHRISDPRIVAVDDVAELAPWWRVLSRVYAIRQWLVVTAAADESSQVRGAPADGVTASASPSVPTVPATP
jgi:deazaflavin-dependent oxidoreductase (nitroreductase family)